MQEIKIWAFALCSASIIAAILESLAPKGQKTSFVIIIRLFLLLTILSPLATAKESVSFSTESLNENSSISPITTNEILKEQIILSLKELVNNKLLQLGIFEADIRIDMNVNEEEISSPKITVTLSSEQRENISQIKSYLQESFGGEIVVLEG